MSHANGNLCDFVFSTFSKGYETLAVPQALGQCEQFTQVAKLYTDGYVRVWRHF
jgi:hypothetical protein